MIDRPRDFSNEAEFIGFMEGFWPRMSDYAKRLREIPEEARGSVKWTKNAGGFLWRAREGAGISRYDLADKVEVPVNNIRYLEFGVEPVSVYEGLLPPKYLTQVGRSELVIVFNRRFGIPNSSIGPAPK